MGSFYFFSYVTLLLSCALPVSSGPLNYVSVSPNFTASAFQFIDHSGAFLLSRNGTFKAAISNPRQQLPQYYFSIIHASSHTIIWTANTDKPISDSTKLYLTIDGLYIADQSDRRIWSTPRLDSPVSAMQLQESGNLVLLDAQNISLWESFDHPTDTIVPGQRLLVGKSLSSFESGDNLSVSDYRIVVTSGDAVLQWNGLTYWKLSMDQKAFKDTNAPASFLAVNGTGLYLFGDDGSTIVIQVVLGGSDFRVAKLGSNGRFSVSRPANNNNQVELVEEFTMPVDNCRIPFFCGKIGLCATGSCSCPPPFHSQVDGACAPTDPSLSLPAGCNASISGSESNSSVSYLELSSGIDYFAINFMEPVKSDSSLSGCKDLCSRNCSCLAIFHENSSGSCYLLENHLGSMMTSTVSNKDRLGYIKAVVASSGGDPNSSGDEGGGFPFAARVLVPLSGSFLLVMVVIMGILWWRRNRKYRSLAAKFGSRNSSSSEVEIISIPGLPIRFEYEELAAATDYFKTMIGTGGFGTVYKGTLQDKCVVAVKKMTNLGVQGKKDFCTEIAIIGNIHHVNLVKLKGFCAQGRQRFLVYEYMNRGSLDRTLFGDGPALEWRERFEIALGTARGLAYLHGGCDHKIIHCDVKPENILLHDNLQVKISDFGLSKLLSPEQSCFLTTLRGTRGYLAPEWLTSSGISDRTDVYSYGMVLLEIVRGRRNCSSQARNQSEEHNNSGGNDSTLSPGSEPRRVYFPLFALEMHEQGRYLELADPRLEGRVASHEVEKLVRIALCCVHEEPMLRPTMANVVGMLEGGMPLGEPRAESLNFLRFYGRRFTEASTVEGPTEQNEFILFPEGRDTDNSDKTTSYNSLPFISSQQLSGPR